MQNDDMKEYLTKLGEFFYPFLVNVELGNVSALENTTNLINAFINFNEVGYFNRPTKVGNIKSGGQTAPPEGEAGCDSGIGVEV
ncbi:hypothetical protein [Symbiopectobacterium purcellii]|uniref:Uncharacterized protein n=1 Tax=Symbiopectobacterium purcellii TaxID=2871826 RepID=A0ABX9AK94_9ENTR|nr:hypothetical protein [Symbiopectobacterium purcellii]QZN94140.1 hypothetical protein K6K13_12125 [Symbiopectobacterium purcellii]